MIKTITAATVERDALGFWTHPDFFEPANGNEFGVEGEFDAWKAFNRVTGAISWMECEENTEELQAAYDAGDCDISMWQPTPPAGEGWFLASIHEAEDGPICYWLRPIECDPEALAAHIDKCYAEAFQNEYLIDERNAALNACALIAEALGITGAVAGDTIARVQQLVAENATLRSDAREAAETVEAELCKAESRGVEKLAKAFKSWADESNGDYEAERHWAVASKKAFSFAADMREELKSK